MPRNITLNSFPKFLLFLISLIFVCYFGIGIILTLIRAGSIAPADASRRSDFSGWYRDGWTSSHVMLEDPWVYSESVRVKWNVNNWRPDKSPAIVVFKKNGKAGEPLAMLESQSIRPTIPSSDRVQEIFEPLSYELLVKNTFAPGTGDERLLGVKLESVELIPKLGILLPRLPRIFPILTLLLGLTLVVSLLSYDSATGRMSLWPATLTLILALAVLRRYQPDSWVEIWPLWLFLMLVAVGGLVYRIILSDVKSKQPGTTPRAATLAMLLIVLAGGILRFSGLSFGLPHFFHPDESRKSKIVTRMVDTGNLDPEYFKHPTFLLYGAAGLTKIYQTATGNQITFPDSAYFGRMVSAILGTASLLVLFLLGTQLYGWQAGLLAASLLAFSPLHVACSRYMKEDVAFVFFMLVSAYFSVRSVKERSTKLFFLCSLFAGFSASAKYAGLLSAWFVGMPPLVAFVSLLPPSFRERIFDAFSFHRVNFELWKSEAKKTLLNFPLVLVFALVGFVIISPYVIFNNPEFIRGFSSEHRHMQAGHSYAITAASQFWMYHVKSSFPGALSWGVALLGGLSLGFLAMRRRWSDLFVLATILVFFLPAEWVRAKPEPQPERYILPCIPFLTIAIAAMVMHFKSRWRKCGIILGVVAVVSCMSVSIPQSRAIKHDTRSEAAAWIRDYFPPMATVVIDWGFYCPHIPQDRFVLKQLKGSGRFHKVIDLESLKALDAHYLVLSSFTYDRYFKNPQAYREQRNLRKIFDTLPHVKSFASPYRYGFHNPTIHIFDLGKLKDEPL